MNGAVGVLAFDENQPLQVTSETTNNGNDNTQGVSDEQALAEDFIPENLFKISAIRADRALGGIGFVAYQHTGNERWHFTSIANDQEGDGLWNWDDAVEDADTLELEDNEFITAIYWHSNSNALQAVQQIGFEIYDSNTQLTTTRRLNAHEPIEQTVDVFDLDIQGNSRITVDQPGEHIIDFEGVAPVKDPSWQQRSQAHYRLSRKGI